MYVLQFSNSCHRKNAQAKGKHLVYYSRFISLTDKIEQGHAGRKFQLSFLGR